MFYRMFDIPGGAGFLPSRANKYQICYPIKPGSKVSIHNSSNGRSLAFKRQWAIGIQQVWPKMAMLKPSSEGGTARPWGRRAGTVGWPWDLNIYTLLESKIAPANGPGPKRNVVFQAPIFRGYFSFREGKVADVTRWLQK